MHFVTNATLRLKGKTLRGKNRINRGGELFTVRRVDQKSFGAVMLVQSVEKGEREMFWIVPNDSDVEVVEWIA